MEEPRSHGGQVETLQVSLCALHRSARWFHHGLRGRAVRLVEEHGQHGAQAEPGWTCELARESGTA